MLLPLNNIRIEITDHNADDFIRGEVTLRLTTKLPRGLCEDPDALDAVVESLVWHVKQLTSDAYEGHPRVAGDAPFRATFPAES